ncbi:MAG: sigma-70 family RNA polymerase sigma factor [Clostridia bacterium]|nr:sigma-70 family RNA polymerase sigma factor [Clostridia bacterium]
MDRFESLVNSYLQDVLIRKIDALDNLMKGTNMHFMLVAHGRLLDKDKTEEVVSDTYLRIVKNVDKCEAGRRGYNWMLTILLRVVKDYNRETLRLNEVGIFPSASVNTNFEDRTNLRIDVEDAMNRHLTRPETTLIKMRYYEGYAVDELAVKFDLTRNQIYYMLSKSLVKIKQHLKGY